MHIPVRVFPFSPHPQLSLSLSDSRRKAQKFFCGANPIVYAGEQWSFQSAILTALFAMNNKQYDAAV
jgi:hypothetical protein